MLLALLPPPGYMPPPPCHPRATPLLPQVKLGDFGVSRALSHQTRLAQTVVGTPYYMSPEVMHSEPYGEPADLWAVGVLLYQLVALRLPFDAENLAALVLHVTSRGAEMVSCRM